MSLRIGFVHTVPALAEAFERDLRDAVPHAEARHRIDAGLLARAREIGVDATVDARVVELVAQLADEGVDAVLVTCSSIGESAERAAVASSVPVVRVDAAMAAEAVALARHDDGRPGRIVVLATVEATLGPTVRLLGRAASSDGAPPTVQTRLLADALPSSRERRSVGPRRPRRGGGAPGGSARRRRRARPGVDGAGRR